MIKSADILGEFAAAEIKTALAGKKCWYAHSTCVSTVGLALGRKIPRERPLKRGGHPDEYCKYEGELHLIIWCSWRLEKAGAPLVSSDGEPKVCDDILGALTGRMVESVEISPGWGLQISFSGGFVLSAFPDHVGDSASFDGNWELWRQDQAYLIGTNLACEVIDRENRPLQLQLPQRRWTVARRAEAPKRRRSTRRASV